MNIRFSKAALCLSMAVLLLSSGLGYAFEDKYAGKNEKCGTKMFDKLKEKLDLTPEQEEQIKEHRKKHREERKTARKLIRKKRKALKEELNKPDSDLNKVDEIALQIKDLMGQQIDRRIESILTMKEILTPGQFKKMSETIEEKRKRMHEKRKKGRGKRRRRFMKFLD